MKTYEIDFWLPAPRDEVFAYVSNVEHLDLMTPDWLRFQVLSPRPVKIFQGAKVDYRLRWRRLPMRWRSEITQWRPDQDFTYEQRLGPYRSWIHEHLFEEVDGGTRVIDRVAYDVFGISLIGSMVAADVAVIFRHRVGVLESVFGAGRVNGAGQRHSAA